ncbi:FtsX-like permease family protein [Peterkaempfera bronchialis]|uniref:FtsX-like permease family protein n=1 Tax=Peterkaempfera bronchialis TaxID=2126346 RepID=UPI003C2BD194
MSAVWAASRAAVKRRRLQTTAIGLVVLCSTTTVLLALSVLAAVAAPFDSAFTRQRGAHVVATFDAARTSDAQLAATARQPGVQAAAGPFGEAVIELPTEWLGRPPGPLTVVGRADPGGPVDRVELRSGHWPATAGEIVVNMPNGGDSANLLGTELTPTGAPPLTVVGFATSMSKSAGAWVTPEQLTALHPTALQMLYRFPTASDDRQIRQAMATVTTGLPADSLTSAQSYLTLKQAFSAQANSYLPFMTVFGMLGLLLSVLIVGNVVSGAVVSGYRHIGVLKALGFTPNQVVAVYLAMVSVPAVAGCVLGALLGTGLARPILGVAFTGIETGTAAIGTPAWVPVVCLLAMPVLVVLAALLPALRAHRLSAAQAITAGSAPRAGRGLRVQRALGGTRLPRSVSLGLGQPFARPARTALSMAAIVLGVTTVTLTIGLTSTMLAAAGTGRSDGGAEVQVAVGSPAEQRTAPKLSDSQTEALLRSLPGARQVTARGLVRVGLVGYTQPVFGDFYGGDDWASQARVVKGRPPTGPDEVVAGPAFLNQHGLRLGDRLTLYLDGRQLPVTIVGEPLAGNAQALTSNWQTLARLVPDPHAGEYHVRLAPGADAKAYIEAVQAADPGLHPSLPAPDGGGPTVAVVGFSTVFTVLLTVVAALGVFNTVLLNIRERRRDLGMLKSIGMTPRQVVAMTVTSAAGLGAVSGLLGIPLGIVAHRLIVDHVEVLVFAESMKNVWHAPHLAGLALAGVVIAVLGALIPARAAARLPIAEVLHNE